MTEYPHTISQGRVGAKAGASWCVECGAQTMDVETRPCGHCDHYFASVGYHGYKKHLMAVSPAMNAACRVADGTCFREPAL